MYDEFYLNIMIIFQRILSEPLLPPRQRRKAAKHSQDSDTGSNQNTPAPVQVDIIIVVCIIVIVIVIRSTNAKSSAATQSKQPPSSHQSHLSHQIHSPSSCCPLTIWPNSGDQVKQASKSSWSGGSTCATHRFENISQSSKWKISSKLNLFLTIPSQKSRRISATVLENWTTALRWRCDKDELCDFFSQDVSLHFFTRCVSTSRRRGTLTPTSTETSSSLSSSSLWYRWSTIVFRIMACLCNFREKGSLDWQ